MSATKEHALEISLNEMIQQWNDIAFETTNYRDSTIKETVVHRNIDI